MPQFTAVIFIKSQTYHFHFYRVLSAGAPKFFVSVKFDGKQVAVFEMRNTNNAWQLLEPVAASIKEVEEQLVQILNCHT